MHSFEAHSNESACRKSGQLGMEQVKISGSVPTDCLVTPRQVILTIKYNSSEVLLTPQSQSRTSSVP